MNQGLLALKDSILELTSGPNPLCFLGENVLMATTDVERILFSFRLLAYEGLGHQSLQSVLQ